MKRKWWLVPAALALIGVLWILAGDQAQLEPLRAAIGLKPRSVEPAKSKPICSSAQVPVGDCMPQWEANLPPDPGEAGKVTLEGITTNSKGVRDDVYRYIWYEFPDSERAREALFLTAKIKQMTVLYGDSLGKEETRKLMPAIMKSVICTGHIEEMTGMSTSATQNVRNQVTNTPERWKKSREFDYLMAHNLYELPTSTATEACGFDPAALAN